MLPKYKIEYGIPFGNRIEKAHYETDDPVACEAFLTQLLDRGFSICSILHDGESLDRHESDRLIKTAASIMASRHICSSLHIKSEEERFRFGFTA
jgi:hypothetical protein